MWPQAYSTPGLVDWMMAQVRGAVSTSEPYLSITNPTHSGVYSTDAATLELSGTAMALGQPISNVAWTNLANNVSGMASGTSTWNATGIPIQADKTNRVIVIATTTSWVPALGGSTTFSDVLEVVPSPIRATLTVQGSCAILNWTGGLPPYRVQRSSDLNSGDWTDVLTDAIPPVVLLLEHQVQFYRIVFPSARD